MNLLETKLLALAAKIWKITHLQQRPYFNKPVGVLSSRDQKQTSYAQFQDLQSLLRGISIIFIFTLIRGHAMFESIDLTVGWCHSIFSCFC